MNRGSLILIHLIVDKVNPQLWELISHATSTVRERYNPMLSIELDTGKNVRKARRFYNDLIVEEIVHGVACLMHDACFVDVQAPIIVPKLFSGLYFGTS